MPSNTMKFNKLRYITLAIVTVFLQQQALSQTSTGQNQTLSPYSNFGIGEWEGANYLQNGYNFHSRSGAYTYSSVNPATLGNLYYTTLDIGANFKTGLISSDNQTRSFNGGGMSQISLAFRTWNYYKRSVSKDSLTKLKTYKSTRFGTNSAIILKPLTTMGYQYGSNNTTPLPTKTTHSGTGGVNVLQSMHALRLGNALSLGYSVGWVFGNLSNQSLLFVPDSSSYRYVEDFRTVTIRGMQQQFGFLTNFKIDTTYHSFGASIQTYNAMRGNQERLLRTMKISGSYLTPTDTIIFNQIAKQSFNLPISFGAGYTFRYKSSWSLSLDYRQQNWSSTSTMFFDNNRTYADRKEYAATFILHPMDSKLPNRKKMQWPVRFGVSQANTQYKFTSSNTNLIEQRAFAGFGIPFVRRYFDGTSIVSMVNFQVDYMQRSPNPANTSLATEKFINFRVGLQLGDIWFQRRKFD